MRTNGSRGSNWSQKATSTYLKLNGYQIKEVNGSQVIVDSNDRIVCKYHEMPSLSYMQRFNHLSEQQNSTSATLHDINAFILQAKYRNFANLIVQRIPHKGEDAVCKFIENGVAPLFVHKTDDYPEKTQIEHFLSLPPARREQILEKLILANRASHQPTSETMKKLLEDAWWGDNIAELMDFLGF